MMRAHGSLSVDAEWCGVSERHPCPICGANSGCSVHEDDPFASCTRLPSDWPLITGAWLHRTETDPLPVELARAG